MKLLSENIKPKRQQDCLVLQSIESSYRKKSNFDFLSICFSSYFASNLSLRINLHKLYTLQSGSRPPPSTNLHFHTLELFWPKYHYYRKRLQNLQIGPTSKLPAPHFLLRYFIVCWFAAQPWATSSLGGGNFWGKNKSRQNKVEKGQKCPATIQDSQQLPFPFCWEISKSKKHTCSLDENHQFSGSLEGQIK